MALSTEAVRRLMISVTDRILGNEIASAINLGTASAATETWGTINLITATSVSTTVDFASLLVGDKVLIFPAAAGNSQFVVVATAGTLPQAAVVGSLYQVLRLFAPPSATNQVF